MSDVLRAKTKTQLERAMAMGTRAMTIDDGGTSFSALVFEEFIAYARAALAEITGEQSSFSKQIEEILGYNWDCAVKAEGVVGVIRAVQASIDTGLLEGQRKLIRGELFSDYLDMAQYLLDEGYKDAAAVIAGSSLEVHLRSLWEGHGIPTSDEKDGQQIPRKAESLNMELRKRECYDKSSQKLVTAWLGTRNDAAHGDYKKYSDGIVKAMLIGVRGFISNHPA